MHETASHVDDRTDPEILEVACRAGMPRFNRYIAAVQGPNPTA